MKIITASFDFEQKTKYQNTVIKRFRNSLNQVGFYLEIILFMCVSLLKIYFLKGSNGVSDSRTLFKVILSTVDSGTTRELRFREFIVLINLLRIKLDIRIGKIQFWGEWYQTLYELNELPYTVLTFWTVRRWIKSRLLQAGVVIL